MRRRLNLVAAGVGLLLPFSAHAYKPKAEPVLIRDAAHPVDSRGEMVYTLRTDETNDEPAVPGKLTMPKPRKLPKPKYPPSLKRAKKEAEVTVTCVLAPDGRVIDAEVEGDVADDIRASTLDAVSRYEITPATLDGRPIALRMKVVVSYRIW